MTPRQEKILHAIVEHYAQTAVPVGSMGLTRKFSYSPATIRSEMAELERLGYITHPHTSAGRVPTDTGYRHYVDSLQAKVAKVEKKRVEDRQSRAVEQRITAAGEPEQAVRSAVDSLMEVTGNLAVGTLGDNIYMNGLSHLFNQPEFLDVQKVYEVARLLDNLEPWLRELSANEKMSVFIGQENPIGKASGCSIIVSQFASPYSDYSYIGIIGPTRQSYPQVINLVERVGDTLEEVLNG